MENMGALLLQAIGGAKRIPWRQGRSAISVQKDQNNNQSANPEQVGAQPGVASSALLDSPNEKTAMIGSIGSHQNSIAVCRILCTFELAGPVAAPAPC